MATRLIGTDTADPRLPAVVIAATQGTTSSDLAPGDVLADANAYTDEVAAEIIAGGVNFADDAETIAGTADNLAVTPAGLKTKLPAVDVREFGAVGDGVADDTTAIQAAIDYCLGAPPEGGLDGARTAIASVYLPRGSYKTTAALRIISCLGFEMYGDGYSSGIRISGARTYGIELNGVSRCHFHDFLVAGLDPGPASTDTVTDAIAVNWTTAISPFRSTSYNVFDHLFVGGKYVNGFSFGRESGTSQVDNLSIMNCIATGQWSAGETTWWQTGFTSGSGASGNTLAHNYVNCHSIVHRYNLYSQGPNLTWSGGQFGFGEVDIRHARVRNITVDGFRSEGSSRVLQVDGGATFHTNVSLSNVLYIGDHINADNRFITIGLGGSITLRNIEVLTATTPKIYFAQGTSPARPCQMTIIGMMTQAAITALFESAGATAEASIVVFGYCQTNSSQQVIGRTPFWMKGLQGAITAEFDNIQVNGTLTAAAGIPSAWATAAPALFGDAGEYWGPPFTRATTALVAGAIYAHAVYVPVTCTIVRIAGEITTLAVGSTLSLGIYEDDGAGDPGVRLLDAGTIDGSTTGTKEITISQVLQGGRLYHFAALCQGGTPTVRTISTSWAGRNSSLGNTFNGLFRAGRSAVGVVGTALPTPFPVGHGISSTVPVVVVRL